MKFKCTPCAVSGIAFVILCILAFVFVPPPKNPDPNHTHADFAVWLDGKQIDFAQEKYMSGSSADLTHKDARSLYLHLHDGNGHVIHRHKPGLTLCDFFRSLNDPKGKSEFDVIGTNFSYQGKMYQGQLYVNGVLMPDVGCNYDFQDDDHLLITNATDEAEIKKELSLMTDDACRYSQTCPWKGKPPTENCIADPGVPCTVQ